MLATVLGKTVRDRWKATAIAAFTLGLVLLMGMAVYRDIDLAVYTDLPEAFRALVNIPKDADVGSLAYGAVYGSYGALTLAALAISMGGASIAGEERDGTIGLLLGNPRSRTQVLVSKAGSMVLLTALGTVLLWGAGLIVPVLLNVDVSGMQIGALMVHMFAISIFYGFLAMALGAWTGKRTVASGTAVTVLLVSLFAAGLLPLIEGVENLAKAFPWYYYEGSQPVLNGIDWGHLSVLIGATVLLAGASFVVVNRRDLRGRSVGVTLLDRLRANPITQKVADRIAGSARVSRIWIKTASEHQGVLIATSYIMFLLMGVMLGPMYTFIDDRLITLADSFPEVMLAMVGGGDMSTPEGWYQVETFGLMAPIAVMVVTVTIGARALAGEEEQRTMGLLLANPITRSTIVREKTIAMAVYAFIVGFAIFAGVALGSVLGGLGMSTGHIAATSLLVVLLGLAFGAVSLVIGAATGRVRLAVYATIGVALISHTLNAFLMLSDSLAGYAKWSPSYYYLTSDPLMTGMDWGHGAVLAGLTLVLVAASVALFQRRDLRQG